MTAQNTAQVQDLMVNGAKPPTERGTCRHLLAKVDRQAIQKALAREPYASDHLERAPLLAGLVRITEDAGLLFDYLETLTHVSNRREAARGRI